MRLSELMEVSETRIDNLLRNYLEHPSYPAQTLQKAMTYAALNGGKRIRPLLVYAAALALNGNVDNADAPACAIELVHTYSLIHDDLPSMDNAELRRGKPACHKTYGEAMAILAGDALQPLAFEIIASHPADLHSTQRLAMIHALSIASGIQGMASGQALDIAGTDSLPSLTQLYQLKTGALLTAAVELGALSTLPSTPNFLKEYAQNIGLAFQIQDDLLDRQHPDQTGKPQGLDTLNKKITYLTLLGEKSTQEAIQTFFQNAIKATESLGEKGEILRELAIYLLQRKK